MSNEERWKKAEGRPDFDVGDHDLTCMLIQNQTATECSCGGIGPNKVELDNTEYTLVPSEYDEGLFYVRTGDASHSSMDVARIVLSKDETSVESVALLNFLATHMKVK